WATQVPDKLQLHLDAHIPTPPVVDWQPLASPVEADSLEQVRADIARQRQDAVADSPDEPSAGSQDELRAFALALASYDSRAEAEAERQRLNDAGYRAYVRQEEVRQQEVSFALYAGPELDLSRLHLLQLHLNEDKRFHFDAERVVAYRP